MDRLLLFSLASVLGLENYSCFPNCEPHQCTGLFGPRVGPQQRWAEVAEWVRNRSPTAHIDDRIVMAPGRFGDQVTSAADMIKQGEILLRLPVNTFLLEEDCFPTEAFDRLGTGYKSSLKVLPPFTWNASRSNGADFTQAGLCLLIHRLLGNESAFEGYIRNLPQQSSGETYVFRPLSELESLRGSDAYRIASVCKRRHTATLDNATANALTVLQEYFPTRNLTVESLRAELTQTLSLCGSRTFNLDSEMLAPKVHHSKLFRPALVPLLDMLNHGDHRTRNCQYHFNISGQYFQLQAIRNISPGEELVHSYGPRSNAELQLFYGFLMDGNTEDFVSVADLTTGSINYNYHTRLGHSLRCHTPYFRPVEGSGWPPKFQTVVQNASPDSEPAFVQLGPLGPAVYRSFLTKLQQAPTEEMAAALTDLAKNSGEAVLRIVDGAFVVMHSQGGKIEDVPVNNETRGNLTVDLVWRGSSPHASCVAAAKPRCEDHAPGISSVNTILLQLEQGALPVVARAGGCLVWSERKRHMFEVKMAPDGGWIGVATTAIPPKPRTALVADPSTDPIEAQLQEEFQYKRKLIRAAGLEEFAIKIFRNGLLPEPLAAVRIAVLPELSALAIHGILSGRRFSADLEPQVARTLGMFCYEELTRRLQVFGVETEEDSLFPLLEQTRQLAATEAQASFERLARSELSVLHDFCIGIANWGLPLWD